MVKKKKNYKTKASATFSTLMLRFVVDSRDKMKIETVIKMT